MQDFQLEVDFTASLQTQAIRDELNEVQSLIESLTLEGGKTTGASKLQTQFFTPGAGRLKLELKPRRARIELARVRTAIAHEVRSKMASLSPANVTTQNECVTELHSDKVVYAGGT